MTDGEYIKLFDELQELEKVGVGLQIDGEPATSVDIVHAHMVRETSSYMRDYVPNDVGGIDQVSFNRISF